MSNSESLALSLPAAPAEVLAREVNSNDARASYGAVASLRAVGRSVEIVPERDRMYGFVAAGFSQRAGKERIATPVQNPLAPPAPVVCLQMVPQAIEKAQNRPEIGAASTAQGDEPPRPFGPPTTQLEMPPQTIEKAQKAAGIGVNANRVSAGWWAREHRSRR